MLGRIGETADTIFGFDLTPIVADVVDTRVWVLGDPVGEGGVGAVVKTGGGDWNREFTEAAMFSQ